MAYLIITIIFFVLILTYFRIADYYNIIDHPNQRSSHSEITIRGGGIIYLFGALILLFFYPGYWLPVAGLLTIGIISFLDDIYTLTSRIRLAFHLLAVTILFLFLNVFNIEPIYICILLYIIVIGVINMYNFMDGINGITGLYSLAILGGLQFLNLYKISFIQPEIIWVPMLASVVFLFFNFRKKAKCFAGDVGSITIAFWILWLLLKVILQTNDWRFILFLSVYGVDAVLTIIHRLILKQRIFSPHRLHFYQLLANENKVPHLLVSTIYAVVQLIIIYFVIFNHNFSIFLVFGIVLIPLILVYLILKPRIMRT